MNLLTSPLRMLALGLFLCSTVALSACTGGNKDNNGGGGGTDNNTAASMATRINNMREAISPDSALSTDTTLTTIAQAQADYNSGHNINSDTDGSGATIAEQMTDAGYQYSTVAYLFNNLGEGATFHDWEGNDAYMNIMNDPGFSDIGVGTAQSGTGLRRWVVIFASKDVPTNGTKQQMLDLLNGYRTAHGKAEFTLNDNLNIVAQSQAEHNASVQANEAATGADTILEQVDNTGYTYGTLMWTLANGGPDAALGIWTDTPTEQTQMQRDDLTEVGIGVASGGTKQWWVVIYAQPLP
jgi:uncharacterized protein YkwD